jgi:hypothetical protein
VPLHRFAVYGLVKQAYERECHGFGVVGHGRSEAWVDRRLHEASLDRRQNREHRPDRPEALRTMRLPSFGFKVR